MRIISRLSPREIEGADKVLEGFVLECASGNHCHIWPAITAGPGKDQARIAFFSEYSSVPATPEDNAEVIAFTNALVGSKAPDVYIETGTPDQDGVTEERGVEWLRSGKTPKPARSN